MRNPYTLLCYILICNQLLECYLLWSNTITLHCNNYDKAVLEPSIILYLQVTQPMSNMFLFYV